jgi:hypothetical protein
VLGVKCAKAGLFQIGDGAIDSARTTVGIVLADFEAVAGHIANLMGGLFQPAIKGLDVGGVVEIHTIDMNIGRFTDLFPRHGGSDRTGQQQAKGRGCKKALHDDLLGGLVDEPSTSGIAVTRYFQADKKMGRPTILRARPIIFL